MGDDSARASFEKAIAKTESLGGERVEIDLLPFLETARLLYEGPWVAERYSVIEDVLKDRPEILFPVTRAIIQGGEAPRAVDAFRSEYRRMELKRQADAVWASVQVVLVPTAGTIFRVEEVEREPVQRNSDLGYYTNFMNLLDYSAIACPGEFLSNGMPFGITFFAPAFQDEELLRLAKRWEQPGEEVPRSLPDGWLEVVVCGAHMRGLALNYQLTDRRAVFLRETTTSDDYRFYALPAGQGLPARPGLIRNPGEKGGPIAVEVWAIPAEEFGGFVAQVPPPLGFGKVELADGSLLSGFLCEPHGVEGAEEVTSLGGWRRFLEQPA
ncbi:MAG: amidase family protein [Verrucomicrobiota bacterium]